MPRLIVRENNEDRTLRLDASVATIGRAPSNTIQILDIKSSREHCYVELTERGYLLVDLASQNGTLVNGTRVNHHLLKPGDKIEIGSTAILYEMEAGESAEAVEPTRPRLLRRRLRRLAPLRRRPTSLPVAGAEGAATVEEATVEDRLRENIDAVAATRGLPGLEEAGQILDEVFVEQTGSSRMASIVASRDNLMRLQEVNKAINSELNLKRLLELIMDKVVELTDAERGFLILLEDEAMSFKVARNFDKEAIRNPEFKISHTIAEDVIRAGRAVLTADAQSDQRFQTYMSVAGLKLRSVLCVPFKVKEKALGCVYIDNRFEGGVFTQEELSLLEAFGDQAAIAIENARMLEELQRKQEDLRRSMEQVEKLNRLLEEKVERQSAELTEVTEELKRNKNDLQLKYDYRNIIGKSEKMQQVLQILDRITDTDVPVLVHGESGTGKELVARAIHFNGPRKAARFVSENCAAIPETLLESELFGYMRGAFTGATQDKKGLFELAHGGTLFLDEIGDMSLEMQKKLLRALQEGEIRRVGGKDIVKVNVRILSASNQDLRDLIKDGRFREDLYYRLNVIRVNIPPLRERKEDIPILVHHFLESVAKEANQARREIDRAALRLMTAYDWPGNVRELENEVRRAVALSDRVITPAALKEELLACEGGRSRLGPDLSGKSLKEIVKDSVEAVEREAIVRVLEESGWVKTETARVLGISRPTLDAKIDAYRIERPQEG